jgi:hypothetical protein
MKDERPNKQTEISKLEEDLQLIKKAVVRSGSILQYMEVAKTLRPVAFLTGAFMIFFCGLFYYFILQHGSYEAIPSQVKMVLYLAIAIAFILVGILKIRGLFARAREIDEQITFIQFFDAVYTDRFLTMLIPFLISLVALPLYFSYSGFDEMVLPLLMIIFALLCFSLSTIFYLREMIYLGAWLLLTGFIFLIWLPELHLLLHLIFGFGVGFLIMAASDYLFNKGKA